MKILNINNKTFVEEDKSFFYLQYEPIDINYYYEKVLDEVCGASSMFSGTTRNYFGEKDVIKLEYNIPHKHTSKLHGFSFTLLTNTVGHLWKSNFSLP